MYWTDIELDRLVEDEALRVAFSRVFQLPVATVVATDLRRGDTADPWAGGDVEIVLDRWVQPGEFPLHVTVLLQGEPLERRVNTQAATIETLGALCRDLGCRGLVGMDEEDPYVVTLFQPTGAVELARLDADALDEERLVLAPSPSPTPRA